VVYPYIAAHEKEFSLVAATFAFKTFLFKSRSNSLKIEDLYKSLNTPNKVIEIAGQLGVEYPLIDLKLL